MEPTVFLLFHDVFVRDPGESGFTSPAANRYKLTVAQFDHELAGLAAVEQRAIPFALTFDDGGESFYTQVADRLEARGWHGYCLISTDYIDRQAFLTRAQIRELHARGHIIGSHSASHPQGMHRLAPHAVFDEWRTSVARLEDLLGSRIDVASVPGGCYSRRVAEAAASAGVRTLFTSEPTRTDQILDSCRMVGRFTIRQHSSPGIAARLAAPAPWSRLGMWAQWNAKAAIKPLLGSFYLRVADWLMAERAAEH
jgi:peptidoglycan/xylan/chitin deacetylase (PgdA/CDA1 family)